MEFNIETILAILGALGTILGMFRSAGFQKALKINDLLIDCIELYQDPEFKKLVNKHFEGDELEILNKLLVDKGYKKK